MALNANHLVTLAEQRAWLGIGVSVVQPEIDSIIETCINGASAMIERFLDRKLILQTVTKRYDGNGRSSLSLGDWPVHAITSIHESNSWVFDATMLVPSTDYAIASDGMFVVLKPGRRFQIGTQNIQVVYQFGYDSPSTPTDKPLDGTIKQAAYMLAEWLYAVRNDRRIGVKTKSKNAEVTSFADGIPEPIAAMLEPFKNDFFIPDTRPVPLG